MHIDTISAEIRRTSEDVLDWFETEGRERFTYAPPGKWTAAQHLDHLIRSANAVNRGLGLPKILLRLNFGKPNRPLRDLEAVKEKYYKGLEAGVKAVGPFIPDTIDRAQRDAVLGKYRKLHLKMEYILARKWDDRSLDRYVMPHPALGKMYVREMLYFVIFHTEHHLQILREKYC